MGSDYYWEVVIRVAMANGVASKVTVVRKMTLYISPKQTSSKQDNQKSLYKLTQSDIKCEMILISVNSH